MRIKKLIGGNLEGNGYIIFRKEGEECYIVDPGYSGERFIENTDKLGLNIKGILLTHHHYDHTGAVEKIISMKKCPVFMHWDDMSMYKGHIDTPLEHNMKLDLGGEEILVLHTPGHTEGSVCFFSETSKLVFTGDTIFNVDLGRTDLEDGSAEKMRASIKDIVNKWDNDITIYPGHGDSCNMKFVRAHNEEFLDIIR